MGVLSNVEPKNVFSYFEEICGIPHGSSDTKKISDYLVAFAKERGLTWRQDALNNVIIWKPGTSGYENSAPVMLQGHMDMVCEKEADCDIDFQRDGLRLELEDGIIRAKGTTLGGDDGIAVAYALAILDSDDIPHPPLEAVFTVDEEIGMLGASGLDCSDLKSRIMLNMDSEDEGFLLVSCAGGVTTVGHLPIQRENVVGQCVTLTVTGLQGGHSGVEIDKGRGNACQLLGRTLYALKQKVDFRLIAVDGGLKDNAIPREATAQMVLLSEQPVDDVIRQCNTAYQSEYRLTDPGVEILCKKDTTTFSDGEAVTTAGSAGCGDGVDTIAASTDGSPACGDGGDTIAAMTADTTAKVITALVNLPGGIQKMSFDIEGLVQTSLNLGILKTKEEEVTFSFAVRSNVGTEKEELVSRIACLMESLGGSVTTAGEYPAWEYRQNSPLRDLMVKIFEEQYGKKPVIQALHAGVECGLFAGKLTGLDCVSFGPDMKDIHTPKESMDVASVQRCWNYVLEILRRLK